MDGLQKRINQGPSTFGALDRPLSLSWTAFPQDRPLSPRPVSAIIYAMTHFEKGKKTFCIWSRFLYLLIQKLIQKIDKGSKGFVFWGSKIVPDTLFVPDTHFVPGYKIQNLNHPKKRFWSGVLWFPWFRQKIFSKLFSGIRVVGKGRWKKGSWTVLSLNFRHELGKNEVWKFGLKLESSVRSWKVRAEIGKWWIKLQSFYWT